MESDGTIMEFNYLTVTATNFMNILDKFDKSECAKNWRDESGVGKLMVTKGIRKYTFYSCCL